MAYKEEKTKPVPLLQFLYLDGKCFKIWFGMIIHLFYFLKQEIEKSHNQNRKTKDGTTDSNKGNPCTFISGDS